MPIQSAPYSIVSPVTYFIDIINFGFFGVSAFGQFGILIDLLVLIFFGLGFISLAFKLHEIVLQKRFSE
jgi:ABC-type multidrug transport system permease subunit